MNDENALKWPVKLLTLLSTCIIFVKILLPGIYIQQKDLSEGVKERRLPLNKRKLILGGKKILTRLTFSSKLPHI